MKKCFTDRKTVESFIKSFLNVLDPKTNEPIKTVMWPPTNQVRRIPIVQNFRDGLIRSMLYWVYDETIASAIIKIPECVFRLYDKQDLLQFGKWDIHYLAQHQIQVAEDIFETTAKEYTSMIIVIIEKHMWLGSMGRSDVLIIEKHWINASPKPRWRLLGHILWFVLGFLMYMSW